MGVGGSLTVRSLSRWALFGSHPYTTGHTVHYPVLSAKQVSSTLGRGMAVERLLEVYSIERYGLLSLLKVKVSGLSAYLALSTRCTPSIEFPAPPQTGSEMVLKWSSRVSEGQKDMFILC